MKYALVADSSQASGLVDTGKPTHLQCGNPLSKIADGTQSRYSCAVCLKRGYLLVDPATGKTRKGVKRSQPAPSPVEQDELSVLNLATGDIHKASGYKISQEISPEFEYEEVKFEPIDMGPNEKPCKTCGIVHVPLKSSKFGSKTPAIPMPTFLKHPKTGASIFIKSVSSTSAEIVANGLVPWAENANGPTKLSELSEADLSKLAKWLNPLVLPTKMHQAALYSINEAWNPKKKESNTSSPESESYEDLSVPVLISHSPKEMTSDAVEQLEKKLMEAAKQPPPIHYDSEIFTKLYTEPIDTESAQKLYNLYSSKYSTQVQTWSTGKWSPPKS